MRPSSPHVGQPRLTPLAAGVLTFVAAACVLVLEIAAGRLLAPYVGVSLTTYTGIIGVILAGIALGAWVGGRLADRVQSDRLLGPTFVLGGLAAMVSVPIVGAVGGIGVGADPVTIVVLAAVGFVAPAAILSAVAPMIVRASLVDLASSGSLVGRLSAIGTLGAISGTFLTGFVLLGLVPTRLLILATGGLLVIIGAGLTVARGRGVPTTVAALAGSLVVLGGTLAAPDPCQRESAYFCMTVLADRSDPDRRTLILDRVRHASVDLTDPTELGFRYVRWLADASADLAEARGPALRVLHIGGGGFTFPRYLDATVPGSRHTVLEIDREVLEVAREELAFGANEAIDVRIGDARLAIQPLPDDSFDLIVGDAFGGLSVPWHLTTREFLAEVDRVLGPEGLYLMNLIDGPRLGFVRAEVATFRDVWPHVAVIGTGSTLRGGTGGNVVLVASHAPIDAESVRQRLAARLDTLTVVVSQPDALDQLVRGAPPLTDDFAPVDQLLVR